MIQLDFNVVFFVGGEEGGVFVVASAFESFILKLDMVTCIFHNVFVEDCSWQASGKEVQCLCCDIFFLFLFLFSVCIFREMELRTSQKSCPIQTSFKTFLRIYPE